MQKAQIATPKAPKSQDWLIGPMWSHGCSLLLSHVHPFPGPAAPGHPIIAFEHFGSLRGEG